MSLWKIRHSLPPRVEYALVGLVAAYGLVGIYAASLRPFAVATSVPLATVPEPVPLARELWKRHDNLAEGYAFAAPPGWIVDGADPAHLRLGRSARELAAAGSSGGGVLVETVPLYEGKGIADAAAADFAGVRPALYDVAVDGRPSLFAAAFERGRVVRQAAYVPMEGRALVVRSASLDPAAFAAFLSDVRFHSSETLTLTP